MKLHRRRRGAQRGSAVLTVEIQRYDDMPHLVLWCESERRYFILIPETEAEVKALMSEAHIIHHAFEESVS